MLPKSKRIPRKTFSLLLNGAKTFGNDTFLIRIARIEGKSSRFGFSVSKKIAKSAVVRNRMRRAGYRSIRDYLEKISPGFAVSLSFRKIPKDDEELTSKLNSILKESKLIK